MNYKDLLEYTIGDTVYLKTDKDQCKRMVTAFCVRQNNYIVYELTHGTTTSWHIALEITSDVDVLMRTTN